MRIDSDPAEIAIQNSGSFDEITLENFNYLDK